MTLTRRAVLAGVAAGLAIPARAATDAIGAALDAARTADPATALASLARFDPSALSPARRLDLQAARAGLAIDAALARRLPPGRRPYRVTPRAGAWQAARPTAEAIERDTALLAADRAAGVVLPRAMLDRTIAALDTARATAATPVAAAMTRQRDALAAQRPAAPAEPGLSRLPDGAALYALLLQRACGTLDPTAAHRRLTRKRDQLLAEADRIFTQLGHPRGPIGARYTALWRDPRHLYPDSDAGRAEAVADMTRTLAAIRTQVPALVGAVPAFCLDVSIRALSPAEIAAGKQGYREPPAPGRPGAYIVDLRDIRRRPRWTLPAVVAHELLPGHMIQLGLEAGTPPHPHPLRLDYAAAFVEGWAIHAEASVRPTDPLAQLGRLHWLLFRTARALADIDLHLHGATPAQIRADLIETHGEPAFFAPFDEEIDRITLEPGSRAADALAWLAIDDAAQGSPTRRAAILANGRKRTEMLPPRPSSQRKLGSLSARSTLAPKRPQLPLG